MALGRYIYFLLIVTLLFSCKTDSSKKLLYTTLTSSQTGIQFSNNLTPTTELNILNYLYYYNGAGVSVADYNNDNLLDCFFTSNQGKDKLYLNQGNLKFKDVTTTANIIDANSWSTGVTHVDINEDGLLDIYVCTAASYRNLEGRNLLYINQGNNEDGVPTFKEEAASYGLDFSGLSTQATFFDYDLDGDLDMYLLNHSVHPNRSYGNGLLRNKYNPISGDILFRNDNKKFVDVSFEANIFQSKIGYGLGVSISDLNNDNYPDIYVGNDFFENDYLYINNQDGSFTEVISTDQKKLGHTTHYSMGNDIADINNDGLTDIISMDMLPRDPKTYQMSGLEFPFNTYESYLKNGYAPQYMQNTLHLNLGNLVFSEIGNLSGIAATEWSWGSLFADFDNDGYKDLFVSNGIKGATNNMDFINFISNEIIQKKIDQGMSSKDLALINKIPEIKVPNFFFKNEGDLTFKNYSKKWYSEESSFSNGCAYADFDNDGDLDLVVNKVNDEAVILRNNSHSNSNSNFIQVSFKGTKKNQFGIGAKIIAHSSNEKIVAENYTTRGYMSSVAPMVHLGLGKIKKLDSLTIVWPQGNFQVLKQVATNQHITVNFENASNSLKYNQSNTSKVRYEIVDSITSFVHNENPSLEFLREPLIPFANTNQGPGISVADINNDGLDDFFVSGAKNQASALYVQNDTDFQSVQESVFLEDAKSEDISHTFIDIDNDDDKDLVVVSGGNEFKLGKPLKPRLYINTNGVFKKDTLQFRDIEVNASKVIAEDFNKDGYEDILIVSDQVPQHFGKTPRQYLLQNDGKGNFNDVSTTIATEFQLIGNVKDAVWVDLNRNGFKDLILVGYWMPITIFYNDGNTLKRKNITSLSESNGLWNALFFDDFDKDGDIDFVVGNWGLNSKLKASKNKPITLYNHDFDNNGVDDPIITYFKENKEIPFASKEALAKQMPFLNKQFLSYQSFSDATLQELLSLDKINKSEKKKVFELSSMYFENKGNDEFTSKKLPITAQNSVVYDITSDDFNNDGFTDLILVGNSYEISTQLGRMDASHGVLLKYDREKGFVWEKNIAIDIPGAARNIEPITIKNKTHFLVTTNNAMPIFLNKKYK